MELMPSYWPSQPGTGFAILCLITGRANEQATPNKTAFYLLCFSDSLMIIILLLQLQRKEL